MCWGFYSSFIGKAHAFVAVIVLGSGEVVLAVFLSVEGARAGVIRFFVSSSPIAKSELFPWIGNS